MFNVWVEEGSESWWLHAEKKKADNVRIHRFELPNPAFKFFTLLKSKNDPDGFCFYLIANLDDLKYDAQLYGARQNFLCFSRQLFSENAGRIFAHFK